MLNILLVIHVVISLLLIVVILLQKNSSDGLAGLGGGGNNMGIVTARSAANFFSRTTIFLAILFMANSLLLANLSNRVNSDSEITHKLKEIKEEAKTKHKLPMAK